MRILGRRSIGSVTAAVGVVTLGVAAISSPAGAAPDVTPIPTGVSASLTCAQLGSADPNPPDFSGGQTWLEIKFDPPVDGSQGGVTVDFTDNNTFSWTSTIGIDAVYVKSSGEASQIYLYAPTPSSPESFGDDGLTTANGQGISHVTFCYDTDNPATTTTAAPPPPPGATTTTAAVLGVSTVSSGATSSTLPTQVAGVSQAQELPRTGSEVGPLFLLGIFLVLVGAVLASQSRRSAT